MIQAEESQPDDSNDNIRTDKTDIPEDSSDDSDKSSDAGSNNGGANPRASALSHQEEDDEEDKAEERVRKPGFTGSVKYFFLEFMDQFHTLRHIAGRFVNNMDMQLFIVFLIAVNGLMMGIGTFDFVKENEKATNIFETTDLIFLIIFTVELGLQFLYHGWRLFLDGWLIFDFLIITISWSFSEVQIIRSFRIFRALRLITRIKVMKNLILALFSVIPRMFAIGLLLFLVSYIFAVMFTQLFKDLYEEGHTSYNYFSRLDDTFLTLFQIMTLDNWSEIAREVMKVYAWAWLPFIAFVIITGFVVVNLIIAVICDAVSALEDEERAKLYGTGDDESSINDESQHPALQEDVREQLDVLETYIDELTNMQEQTLRTLQILTRQMEDHKDAVGIKDTADTNQTPG
eukprot:CAMPEP_0198141178 /NCGR_PEP_ID=MMETSP1443-20131203/4217_1 /TAXON_ID=186043 /ORGANISM="Entomoneis sp., Strain CCMP2396" /LENGTH=401 /DNA_ID=CAMNT_0043803829 /DNA_START=68 /DNA_END=1273 /DNA_ORIENTATION=+